MAKICSVFELKNAKFPYLLADRVLANRKGLPNVCKFDRF